MRTQEQREKRNERDRARYRRDPEVRGDQIQRVTNRRYRSNGFRFPMEIYRELRERGVSAVAIRKNHRKLVPTGRYLVMDRTCEKIHWASAKKQVIEIFKDADRGMLVLEFGGAK